MLLVVISFTLRFRRQLCGTLDFGEIDSGIVGTFEPIESPLATRL